MPVYITHSVAMKHTFLSLCGMLSTFQFLRDQHHNIFGIS